MPRTDPPPECDVVVVGAGIVGLAAARELVLRHDGLRVVVLERESRIAAHQSGRTSGVIHAGVYYRPGSLKARLCVAGARELYSYCEEHGIRTLRSGKVIVATVEDELAALDELERRGRENEVPGLRRIGPDELREIEPHATGIAALHSPETGVVDFAQVAASFAAELEQRGGRVATGCAGGSLSPEGGSIAIAHTAGTVRAAAAICCAGAWSDRLATACGAPAEPRIVPFRGAYLRLRPERRGLVRGNIYPVPDPDLPFLGMHLTRRIDSEVLAGPSALLVGARDGSLVDDFVVHRTERAVHVRNAPSPAATSSLALARLIADEAEGLIR